MYTRGRLEQPFVSDFLDVWRTEGRQAREHATEKPKRPSSSTPSIAGSLSPRPLALPASVDRASRTNRIEFLSHGVRVLRCDARLRLSPRSKGSSLAPRATLVRSPLAQLPREAARSRVVHGPPQQPTPLRRPLAY
jgi:hypothetical protein